MSAKVDTKLIYVNIINMPRWMRGGGVGGSFGYPPKVDNLPFLPFLYFRETFMI